MEKNLEEEYFKQAKKDDRNKDMNGKSPLDEFIDDRKKGIYEIIGSAVSIPEYLEESIRLAVQKHSEAVIPISIDNEQEGE